MKFKYLTNTATIKLMISMFFALLLTMPTANAKEYVRLYIENIAMDEFISSCNNILSEYSYDFGRQNISGIKCTQDKQDGTTGPGTAIRVGQATSTAIEIEIWLPDYYPCTMECDRNKRTVDAVKTSITSLLRNTFQVIERGDKRYEEIAIQQKSEYVSKSTGTDLAKNTPFPSLAIENATCKQPKYKGPVGDQSYEYRIGDLMFGFEFNANGSALLVINNSKGAIYFRPEDIKIKTSTESYSPCTLHNVQFGIGAPFGGVSVGRGKKRGTC